MMPLRLVVIVFLFLIASDSFGQQTQGSQTAQTFSSTVDSIIAPTVKQKGRFKANWKKPYPNPLRAGIYALIFPGAGQFYNKRYWKLPLVWGAVGGVIYAVDFNTKQKSRFETAYGQRVLAERESVEPYDEFAGIISSATGIKRFRDQAEKNREMSYVGLVAVYALQALEAYVDAHLKSFDISDDLSLSIQPMWESGATQSLATGFSLRLQFY